MSKGDFNLDDNYFVEDPQTIDEANQMLNGNNNQSSSYGINGDFSNVGVNEQNNVIDDASVLFEDNEYETGSEKLKYFFSTLNKKLLTLIGIVIAVIIAIIIIIVIIIASINASYKSEIEVPDLLYMNETSSIEVHAKGKKELNKTVTTFNVYKYTLEDEYDYDNFNDSKLRDKGKSESIDDYDKIGNTALRNALYEKRIKKFELNKKNLDNSVASFADPKTTGKDTDTTLIPIQEGRAIIKIESRLGRKKMADIKKKITVCPAFNNSLIYGGKVSLIKGSTFKPSINFGLGNCAEDITYSSSNEEIFTVSETGEIRGIALGSALLTVAKGSRNFSVPVHVTEDFVSMGEVKFTPEKVQLVPEQNVRIKVSYKPDKATSQNFKFQSEDENVAIVSSNGLITGVSKGSTVIKCMTSAGIEKQQISVVVSDSVNTGDSNITDLKLESNELILVQGSSNKIMATVVPENAVNKTLTYNSEDPNIATVNKSGVIFAKEIGETVINVATANNIQKSITVKIVARRTPRVVASDKILSNKWHNKQFTLTVSGADSGSEYYYGTSPNKVTKKGTKIKINKDQNTTYYVKACAQKVCSELTEYVALLDTVKPKSTIALTGNDSATIALEDATSMVNQVCVTTDSKATSCNWKTIKPANKPVVNYTAKANGSYYVFAKDVAGNVSSGNVFYISGIGEE